MRGADLVWNVLCGVSTRYTSESITTNIVSTGTEYSFRYRVENIHGWSEYSSLTSIFAASVPGVSSQVSSLTDSLTGNLIFTWSEPTDTGGLGIPIDDYLIQIKTGSLSYLSATTYCNEATLLLGTCTLSMTDIITRNTYSQYLPYAHIY